MLDKAAGKGESRPCKVLIHGCSKANKYSWEEKIRAVEHYLSDGTIDYPNSCLTPSKTKTYAKHVRFWKVQYLLKGKERLRHKNEERQPL